jgi:hypothetical protein
MRVCVILLFFLLAGCGDGSEEYDMSGRSIGAEETENLFTVFIEDNLGGNELTSVRNSTFDAEAYEVEAYNVLVSEDTVIKVKETGEETAFRESGLGINVGQWVEVKVEGDFTPEKQDDRDGYIMRDRSFLPVYEAEEVLVAELEFENLHHYVVNNLLSSFGEANLVLIVAEEGSEAWNDFRAQREHYHQELSAYGSGRKWIGVQEFPASSYESFNPPQEYDTYPVYLIYSGLGLVEMETEWEGVVEYFRENS